MARFTTVKYFEATGPLQFEQAFISSASRSKVVYTSPEEGSAIVIQGKNLKLDDGFIDSGTITKVTLMNGDGTAFQIHSGFKVNADHVWVDSTPADFTVALLVTAQFRATKHIGAEIDDTIVAYTGNDILLGRGGSDTLAGGRGNDRLTGGEGSDTFVFNVEGIGRDRILDFDADGGGSDQDYIKGTFADATVTQDGANTVLDFGDGDVLTLLNINTAQISGADFVP
ncbi:hypothetical protein IHQ71_30920 (plasmid) [Rhizobium sp. TH2]|uniref:hypothetical protein n=1 Tax=Rhizobium sp. TH2 TaxID=2775403 RepID=UPI0021574071|nr:hypothetical protein [Rhizobium sp. TH2]UVC12416.1 hypothetical protein IHQ71_30920 [Rhizobium sp. TH2]